MEQNRIGGLYLMTSALLLAHYTTLHELAGPTISRQSDRADAAESTLAAVAVADNPSLPGN